jgi:hypothetical protein
MNPKMRRDGWVPIRLSWNRSTQPLVDWCWLGSQRFTEPFFDGSIEIAQNTPFNRLFTHSTPIEELGEWYTASPGLPPTGFIFHMSRCGSTLVSNMLAASHRNVVISEAGPIDRLARAVSIPEPTRAEWLRWMISALGQKRSGRETRYFIKFDSPTVVALSLIRAAFPATPWIFLYRDPEEVLVSHLQQPAPAMTQGFVTDVAVIDAPLEDVVSMSPEEYAARVLGRICECASLAMDERGALVNYTQLPHAVSGEIARHFAVDRSSDAFSPEEVAQMMPVALQDAKRPQAKFQADGDSKRSQVSPSVRAAAARWILPHYQELERLRTAARIP